MILEKLARLLVDKESEGDKESEEYLEAEPVEIIYDKEKREFRVAKGVVDLGYMGMYPYEKIDVMFEKEEFFEASEEDDQSWNEMNEDMTDEELAKGLTKYCNERIEDIYRHINEINNYFLMYLFEDMLNTDCHFWEQNKEMPSFLMIEKMPKVAKEDLEQAIYTPKVHQRMKEGIDTYYEVTNKEKVEKADMGQLIKECFPMIDLNKLTANIQGEYLSIGLEEVAFQCSSQDCDLRIACGACATIRKDNSFDDWHNF